MADSEKSTEKENPENFKFRAEKEVYEALDHIVTFYDASLTRQRLIEKSKEKLGQIPQYTKQQIKYQLGKHPCRLVLDLNTWNALDEQKSVTVQILNEDAIEEVKRKVRSLARKIDAVIPVLHTVSSDLRQISNTLNKTSESIDNLVKELRQM